MIVITGCTRVGTLVHDVFRATSFQILPIARSTHTLSNQQLNDEQTYIHLLENHLKQNGFYFSYRMDLTLSVQRQAQVGGGNDWRNVRCIKRKKDKHLLLTLHCVGGYSVFLESISLWKNDFSNIKNNPRCKRVYIKRVKKNTHFLCLFDCSLADLFFLSYKDVSYTHIVLHDLVD